MAHNCKIKHSISSENNGSFADLSKGAYRIIRTDFYMCPLISNYLPYTSVSALCDSATWNSVNQHSLVLSGRGTERSTKIVPAYRKNSQHTHIATVRWEEVPIWLGVKDRWKGGRSVFLESFRLSRAFTWSSTVPPMIPSAADGQRLCPTQRALSSIFSNRG
jgi:hypothetical protein